MGELASREQSEMEMTGWLLNKHAYSNWKRKTGQIVSEQKRNINRQSLTDVYLAMKC
jgi:hypothetical protein